MARRSLSKPAYVGQLIAALKKKLPDAEITPEQVRNDRYRFEVIWSRFNRMDHPKRQRLVWEVAQTALDKRDLLNVSMILTLGPADVPKAVG